MEHPDGEAGRGLPQHHRPSAPHGPPATSGAEGRTALQGAQGPAPHRSAAADPAAARSGQENAEQVAFVLLPNFSLGAFSAALEPLRLANRAAGVRLYHWACYSPDGAPIASSAELVMPVAGGLNEALAAEIIILVGGEHVTRIDDGEIQRWLRRADRLGRRIGAVCTGSWALARAGLLDGETATIHWENLDAFAETFPKVQVSADLFEVDGKFLTSAGGFSSADMMLVLISERHGESLSLSAAEQLVLERVRSRVDSQNLAAAQRLGARHPKLLQVVRRMEENLESPLSRAELVKGLGISTRQMERLFRKYLRKTPARYYLDLRLDRARLLLLQTQMGVLEVALACGFVSASHFSRCYRSRFHHTPRNERGLERGEEEARPAMREGAAGAAEALDAAASESGEGEQASESGESAKTADGGRRRMR